MGREGPAEQIGAVIGEPKSPQIDARRPRIVDLDPVRGVAILILQGGTVRGHDLIQQRILGIPAQSREEYQEQQTQ